MSEIDLPCKYDDLDWRKGERSLVRDAYIEKQNGLCYFCHNQLSGKPARSVTDKDVDWDLFPLGFLRHPVHLHHSHKTGMTIGAVHAYCNAVLWQYHGE